MFQLTSADVDCPGFPLFSLFTIAMGMTSCLPDMDPSRPSQADPSKLFELIENQVARRGVQAYHLDSQQIPYHRLHPKHPL